jgi:hypothetical protein
LWLSLSLSLSLSTLAKVLAFIISCASFYIFSLDFFTFIIL